MFSEREFNRSGGRSLSGKEAESFIKHDVRRQRITDNQARFEQAQFDTADLNERVDERQNLEIDKEIAEEKATTDPLTKLFNRRGYDEHFSKDIKKIEKARQEQNIADDQRKNLETSDEDQEKEDMIVAVFDIDFFKRVNDEYGHLAGDKVLKKIGTILNEKIRSTTDSVYRFGGEEFVITLANISRQDAEDKLNKLRELIENTKIDIDSGQEISVTVSIGFSELRDKDDPDTVFKRADKAVYAAKEGGRNQVMIFDDNTMKDETVEIAA